MGKVFNPLEKEVERTLVQAIKARGGYCLKWVCPGWAGVPDRICLLPGGRVFFVELKRPDGGVVAPRQTAWSNKLTALGFDVRIIHTAEEVALLANAITGAGADWRCYRCAGRVFRAADDEVPTDAGDLMRSTYTCEKCGAEAEVYWNLSDGV